LRGFIHDIQFHPEFRTGMTKI